MPKMTPEEAAQKWANRTTAATGDMAAGIARVTTAPGQKAAAKSKKWLAGVTSAEDKFKSRVASVSLSDWQEAAGTIGVQRVAAGVQAKQHKMAAFQREFFPHLERVQAAVAAMDDSTPEARIQRAVFTMRENAKFRRTGR